MFLNIKKIATAMALLFMTFASAQEEIDENMDDISKDDHYGIFKLGAYYPIAFGNNFANNSLDQSAGMEFSFLFNLFDSDTLLGINFNLFGSDVTNEQLVGTYQTTGVFSIGPILGYNISLSQKLKLTTVFGGGYVQYNNTAENFTFKDTGGSIWLQPTFAYQFTKTLGVFISTSYRRDFLDINVPQELEGEFNGANYITFSGGIRLVI